MGSPTVFTISVAGQGEKFWALIQLKIYRFFFLLLNIGRQKNPPKWGPYRNGFVNIYLRITEWNEVYWRLRSPRLRGTSERGFTETWFPNLAPATTINKWVVPLLCAPVGIKNKLHSLLDNAPNYLLVGYVIQKGWWNRFCLGGPEWLEVSIVGRIIEKKNIIFHIIQGLSRQNLFHHPFLIMHPTYSIVWCIIQKRR